jgi:hypothetical protein
VAVADAMPMSGGGYMALKGGTAAQRINILEVFMGGQATASSPSIMLVARDSADPVGTLSGGRLAALDPATANLVANPIVFNTAQTTQPQRSAALSLLNLSFNPFGGIVRWNAAPGQELGMLGNAVATLGEMSLSAFSPGSAPGPMGSHFLLEPF